MGASFCGPALSLLKGSAAAGALTICHVPRPLPLTPPPRHIPEIKKRAVEGLARITCPASGLGPAISGSSWMLLTAELGGSWQSLRLGRPGPVTQQPGMSLHLPGIQDSGVSGLFLSFLCVYHCQQTAYFLMPWCCAKSHLHKCLLSVLGLSV